MILYFVAAFGFLVTGILGVYIAKGQIWNMLLYTVMTVAAIFGIVSSMFVNKDPWMSFILNAVSVHLFALEAISLIVKRFHAIKKENLIAVPKDFRMLDTKQSCGGLSILSWLLIGDICFFIGTSGDVVLSYFYLLEQDYIEHAGAAIGTSVFWLLASLLYLGISTFNLHNIKRYFNDNGLQENRHHVCIVRLITVGLIGLAASILILGLAFGYSEDDDASTVAPTHLSTSGTFDPIADNIFNTGTSSPSAFSIEELGGTFLPADCMMEMSQFSQITVKVTLSVTPAIYAVEVIFPAV
jgi:hypothetical protein